MSANESKQPGVEPADMDGNERQFWAGIALLVIAGVLLFAPIIVGSQFAGTAGAVAVLGLAASAVLVGTAGDERPV